MKKRVIRSLFILLLAGILLCASSASADSRLIGNKLKNIKVKTTTGETFDLYKTLEEKDAVLIDLWFIECDFCWQNFYYMDKAARKYGDSIAYLALDINGSDKLEEIAELMQTQDLEHIIVAKDAGVRGIVHANMFPHTVLVGKGGIILADDLYLGEDLGGLYTFTAGLTDEYYADLAAWTKKGRKDAEEWFEVVTYYHEMRDDDETIEGKNRAWVDRASRDYPYTPESKLTYSVSGEGLREIVVDENLNVLKRWKHLGKFYIAPEGQTLTVNFELGKGVNFKKLTANGLSLDSAVKDGKTYSLSFTASDLREYTFIPGDKNAYRDGNAGFICFASEESAAWFFRQMSMDSGYPISWHIAE